MKFEKYFTSWDIGSLKKIWKFGKDLEIREVFGNLEKKLEIREVFGNLKKN